MRYLNKKNGEFFYEDVNLLAFAKQNKTPCKIVFLDIIKKQIENLQNALNDAIKNQNYGGKFFYLYATKANYSSEIVYTATSCADGCETSSGQDLKYTHNLLNVMCVSKQKPVVCNGFKTSEYLDEILKMHSEGFNIVDVVDDLNELDYLLKQKLDRPLKIGLRVNLASLYGHDEERDRFGLSQNDIEAAKQKLKNQNNLVLTTLHFHQRGFVYEEDKFFININKVLNKYVEFKSEFNSLTSLDIGGGTPWSYEGDFDYQSWAENLIKSLIEFCKENKIDTPNLIIENGKYTVKDAIVNIYKVEGVKNTDSNFSWYILNTSLMLAIPEYFVCQEPMKFLALNNLDKEKIKVKLSGITCDCDDIYYDTEQGFMLMPKIENEDLYVAIIGTGSYQESMAPQTGIRHCLVPNEKRFISYIKDNERKFVLVQDIQTTKEIFKQNKVKKRYLSTFKQIG